MKVSAMKTIMRSIGPAVLLTSMLSSEASANLVTNGSFETFTGVFGGDGGAQLLTTSTALTGWTIVGGEIAILKSPNNYNLTPSDGNNFLDVAGYSNSGFPKGISQTISGLDVGQSYSLSMDLGIRNGACVSGGNNCIGPVQVSATIGSSSQTFTYNSATAGNNWGNFGFDFQATASSMLLQIKGVSLPSGAQYIGLDNVTLNPVVPLPAGLWLLGSGLAGLGLRIRRRA
jgi:hypothetical protein